MKAAWILNGVVHVGTQPDPVPARGQALVRTHRCALCASDAHFLHFGRTIVDLSKQHDGPYAGIDLDRPMIPGHAFVGAVWCSRRRTSA